MSPPDPPPGLNTKPCKHRHFAVQPSTLLPAIAMNHAMTFGYMFYVLQCPRPYTLHSTP